MPPAPLPANEDRRIQALNALELLDTPRDPNFENVLDAAAQFFDAPMAAISLIDNDRQWFKSKRGLEITETSRRLSFCAHAILEPEHVLYVPDATSDPRFSDNPLVTGAPGIRFYAGAPIVCPSGQALGAICVIDDKPRHLPAFALQHLQTLSRSVTSSVHLHRTLGKLRRVSQQDYLTDALNRMGFQNALARLVNGRLLTEAPPPQFSAMVGLDLRSFKSVNDRLGHAGGDAILKAVVSRLLDAAAPLDLVTRQGGDMFTVFVHDAGGPAEIERLRAGFEGVFAEPFFCEGELLRLSASIGFSIVSAAEFDVPALMAAADAALFAARHRHT